MNVRTVPINDDLPHGLDDGDYMKEDKVWPNLEKRLGWPRILFHPFYPLVRDWLQTKYWKNPEDFSYLEAGCGQGNDLRALRNELGGKGRYLGLDLSLAAINSGLDFYQERGEDREQAVRMFALGDINHASRGVKVWNYNVKSFSERYDIMPNSFDVVYMEAVLQASGYGRSSYQEKKMAARKSLMEIYFACCEGGKFFGRVTAWAVDFADEREFDALRESQNWRFIPGAKEFIEMLENIGFQNIKSVQKPSGHSKMNPSKRGLVKISFLAEK